MRCPCLTGTYMLSCAARGEVYIPSAFEYAEYCNSERRDLYKVCSYYVSSPRDVGVGQPDTVNPSGTSGTPDRSGLRRVRAA